MAETKNKISVSLNEQETVITIDPVTKRASVYSCIPNTIKALYKLADNEDVNVEKDDSYGLMISVPQNWIKIRPPVKRAFSEEQRAAMSERLKGMRKNKNENKNP